MLHKRKPVRIEVAGLPNCITELDSKIVILIDVLRASSTIVTLLDRGCDKIFPAHSREDAFELRNILSDLCQEIILCGDDGAGSSYEDFQLSNSPSLVGQSDLEDALVIITSLSGTNAVIGLSSATRLYIGCALNATRVAAAAVRAYEATNAQSIALVCAGFRSHFVALDDLACAGLILSRIMTVLQPKDLLIDDLGLATHIIYKSADFRSLLEQSSTGYLLSVNGLRYDIDFCSQIDFSETVPVLIALKSADSQRTGLLYLRKERISSAAEEIQSS